MNNPILQKMILISATLFVVLLALYFVAIKPVFDTKTHLIEQINTENELHVFLQDANTTIGTQKVFPTLTQNKAVALIKANLSVAHTSTAAVDTVSTTLKKQNFDRLKNGLYLLKNNYGIVATTATISRVASGLVDATFEFTHP